MKKASLFLTAFLFLSVQVLPQDLPLVFTKPKQKAEGMPLTLLVSGDGGWYKFEQAIADTLSRSGVFTIGLDIKKYFREKRTPETITSDIVRTLKQYESSSKKDHFVLIGYSLGAEMIPFIVSRLPEDMRTRVRMYVMLSPSETTDFSIHVADLLGLQSKYDTYKVIEEIKKNAGIPSLCIFGSEEKTKVPSLLRNTGTKVAIIPGDHHFNRDAAMIVRTMKEHKAF